MRRCLHALFFAPGTDVDAAVDLVEVALETLDGERRTLLPDDLPPLPAQEGNGVAAAPGRRQR